MPGGCLIDAVIHWFQAFFFGLEIEAIERTVGLCIWVFIVWLSARRVAGSDFITGLLFGVYSAFTGVVLIFALPQRDTTLSEFGTVLAYGFTFLFLSLLWFFRSVFAPKSYD